MFQSNDQDSPNGYGQNPVSEVVNNNKNIYKSSTDQLNEEDGDNVDCQNYVSVTSSHTQIKDYRAIDKQVENGNRHSEADGKSSYNMNLNVLKIPSIYSRINQGQIKDDSFNSKTGVTLNDDGLQNQSDIPRTSKESETSDDVRVMNEQYGYMPEKKDNFKIKFDFKNSLKIPSPMKSATSPLKRQLESPHIDISKTSSVLGFSVDLSDNLKQSLKEIVQREFETDSTAGQFAADENFCNEPKNTEIQNEAVLYQRSSVNDLEHTGDDISSALDLSAVSKADHNDSAINLSGYPLESSEFHAVPKDDTMLNVKTNKPRRYGQRPQICGHCGKLFLDPYNFKQHLLIHTGEKPFKCDICGRGFSRNNHLTRHILIHTGERPYHCDICGSDFSRSSTLALHKRSHTKEKNYNCKICGKDFTLYWNLVVHLRIHTGERPFKCEICHKTSRQKSDFNRHMKTHSGEKPYSCFLCSTKFSRSSCLKRHWNKFHPDKSLEEYTKQNTEEQAQSYSNEGIISGEGMTISENVMEENDMGINSSVYDGQIYNNNENMIESEKFTEENDAEIGESVIGPQVYDNNEGMVVPEDLEENDTEIPENLVKDRSNVVQVDEQTYEFTFNRSENLNSNVDNDYTMFITEDQS